MDDARPLLIFDTGVGGLSIVEPIRRLLPRAPLVYAADSAGFPYGEKSEAELTARVPALLGRLAERARPRLIVIACNTASVIALDPVRHALDLPIVGTVPAIKPAAEISKSRVMGVLGTQSTVRQPYVDDLAARFASDCVVLRHGSHELVEFAEAKLRDEPSEPAAYARILEGLFAQPGGDRLDTIVLACTHFPLVEHELAAAAPRPVAFVHGGEGIARRVAFLTEGQGWPEAAPEGRVIFVTEGPGDAPDARPFRANGFSEVELL
ncbi:MAG: glutamate racemase [Sphingomonadaceae bacterium]|nr:glutamate racemase [Sphingomonadaceae bacterium]